jgi:hypothetical protein
MSVPVEIEESIKMAVDAERRRIVGMVLKVYALARLEGEMAIANVLDALATDIEKSR